MKRSLDFKKSIVSFKFLSKIFWVILFLLLCLKYVLITNFGDEDFLRTYKFFSADSYDWIANGLRLFQNDNITFRPPGLPIVIKLLYSLKILFFLPLINQIVFFFILFYISKLVKLFTQKKYIYYSTVIYLFLNYGCQNFANYILADYYTILLITVSLYVLLKGKYSISFLFLGLSLLFQNFAFFLLPIWIFYVFYNKNLALKQKSSFFKKLSSFKYITTLLREQFIYLILFLNFNIFWFLYKFIKFENPLYTKLDYFALIRPNFNSLFFYSVNTYTLFGIVVFVTAFFIIWNIKKFIRGRRLLLIIGLLTACFFWMILYEWNDRRFLLYLIPFLIPLMAIVLEYLIKRIRLKYLLLFIFLLYPSFLSISDFFNFYTIPVFPQKSLVFRVVIDEIQQGSISFPLEFQEGSKDIKYWLSIFNPTYAELIFKIKYYREDTLTLFTTYNNLIKDNNTKIKGGQCVEISEYSSFQMNSILLITENKTIEDVDFKKDCP